MLLLLLNYVVLRALWKIDVYLISTLVDKSLYYYYYYYYYYNLFTVNRTSVYNNKLHCINICMNLSVQWTQSVVYTLRILYTYVTLKWTEYHMLLA